MSEALILDPLGIEGLCEHPFGRKRAPGSERGIRCTRPSGHSGCHWAPMNATAESFILWHAGVTILRSRLSRVELLNTERRR